MDELLTFYEDNWDKKFYDKIVIADNNRKAEDYKEYELKIKISIYRERGNG